jgi:hypothetical protein
MDEPVEINYTVITAVSFIVIISVLLIYMMGMLWTISDQSKEIEQLKLDFKEYGNHHTIMSILDGTIAYDEQGYWYRFDNKTPVIEGEHLISIDIRTNNPNAIGTTYGINYDKNVSTVVFHLIQ